MTLAPTAPAPLAPAPAPTARRTSAELEHEPPAQARRHTRQALHRWHLHDPATDAVELVVSELVTNACTHGATSTVGLALTLERDTVLIEVTDDAPTGPAAEPELPGEDAESGRGLCIVAALATDHGRRPAAGRSTSWARIPREQ